MTRLLAAALIAVALAAPVQASIPSPAAAVRSAVADARRLADLRPQELPYTRYLSLYNVPPAERTDYVRWLTFWLWSLSREADPGRPRRVTADLVAIDLREYGIDPQVYRLLAEADPYFHVSSTTDGKQVLENGLYATRIPDDVNAEVAELSRLLGGPGVVCLSGILRADWFVYQTSIQDQRGGAGYYDFLGIKDRASFEELVGLDPKLAAKRKAEWRAIVAESGVSHFPRQIVRLGAVDGGAWRTLDVLDDSRGPRNAIRRLDGDYQHQAEEHYGFGPSGLFVFLLCEPDGTRQDAAPDKIGPDKTRAGHNRTRIEIGASCVRCHLEGLRPVDSWAKQVLQTPTAANVDEAKAARIRATYFRDLAAKLAADNAAYATRLRECNGLTPAANAKIFAKLWDRYESPLTLADCARELGTTSARLESAFRAVKLQGALDPAFAGLVPERGGSISIRRDQWEEVFPVAMLYLGGRP